jgi:hypothetical protein
LQLSESPAFERRVVLYPADLRARGFCRIVDEAKAGDLGQRGQQLVQCPFSAPDLGLEVRVIRREANFGALVRDRPGGISTGHDDHVARHAPPLALD